MFQNFRKWRLNSVSYYLVKVELAFNKQVKYFMLAKKLARALDLDRKQGIVNYIKPLQNAYLPVPVSDYNKNNNAILSVARIISVKKVRRRPDCLCTRSQFVLGSDIVNIEHAYNFMRHDYPWYDRMCIYFGLLFFREVELKKQRQRKLQQRMRYYRNH